MRRGETEAADELLTLVYDELRRIATRKMSDERAGHTLQPTALVHEAWLRLVQHGNTQFADRQQFFAAAAEAMRRILIDAARRKRSRKRGSGLAHFELDEVALVQEGRSDELLALNEALDLLAQTDQAAAELVKLRYFIGLSMEEAAEVLALPLRSTERLWTFAKAWLRRKITSENGPRAKLE